jgi:hypothetical protein
MSGGLIGKSLAREMAEVHRRVLGSSRSVDAQGVDARTAERMRCPTYRIILDEDIDAAASPLGPPTGSSTIANCTVCELIDTTDFAYRQTSRRLAVSNYSDEDYQTDDAAWAVWQDGHYILAGCPVAVPDRPTPPWEATP